MKKLTKILGTGLVALAAFILCSAAPSPAAPTVSAAAGKVRTVNFKKCVEQSKIGKQEQAAFEALKKQMESVLAEKEKTLNEMATKLEDADYLDSLSAESETEMKRKFRGLGQEYTQLQSQYLQTLNQTNFKVIQKITEKVTAASDLVAKQNGLDLILNDEGSFFTSPSLDISPQIITVLDQMYETDAADEKAPATQEKALPTKK